MKGSERAAIAGAVLMLAGWAASGVSDLLERREKRRELSEVEQDQGGPPIGPCAPCMAARLARIEARRQAQEEADELAADRQRRQDFEQGDELAAIHARRADELAAVQAAHPELLIEGVPVFRPASGPLGDDQAEAAPE